MRIPLCLQCLHWLIAAKQMDTLSRGRNFTAPSCASCWGSAYRLDDSRLLYAQALAKGNTTKAVKCLRGELTPLQVDTDRLHKLANAIMCQDEEDLQKTLKWAGPDNGSRQQLLHRLQVLPLALLLCIARTAHLGPVSHCCICTAWPR